MGDRRCCCECWTFADTFTRVDNTDLGSEWDEVAEDSDIYSHSLRVPAQGIVATTHEHFHNTMLAWADIPGVFAADDLPAAVVGDIYRVMVAYYDENNYLCAEYEIINSTTGTLRAVEVNGGIGTVLDEEDVSILSGPGYLKACRSVNGLFVIYEGNEEVWVWGCVEGDNLGRKAGVANWSAANTVRFDNFNWSEHYETNTTCPKCPCECDGECFPNELLLTITTSGGCSGVNEEEITLTLVPGTPDFLWRGTKVLQGLYDGEPTVTWDLLFYCAANEGCPLRDGQFRLADYGSGIGPSDCNDNVKWADIGGEPCICPASIQCDPLIIVYGPMYCTQNPEIPTPLCTMYFTITEV